MFRTICPLFVLAPHDSNASPKDCFFVFVLSAVYPAAYAIVSYCLASFTFNTSFPVARFARQISCSFLSV